MPDLGTGLLLRTLNVATDGYESIFFDNSGELMGLSYTNPSIPGSYDLRKINTTTGETTLVNSSPLNIFQLFVTCPPRTDPDVKLWSG